MGVPLVLAVFLCWQILLTLSGQFLLSAMVVWLLLLRLTGSSILQCSGALAAAVVLANVYPAAAVQMGHNVSRTRSKWQEPQRMTLQVHEVIQGRWGRRVYAEHKNLGCVRIRGLNMPMTAGDRIVADLSFREQDASSSNCTDAKAASARIVPSWRHKAWQKLLKYTGPWTGGLVLAATVADRSVLDSTITSQFRGRGLSHLLAVSGLHFGLVAWFIALLASLVLIPAWHFQNNNSQVLLSIRTAAILMGITAYGVVTGWPDSVVRAFALIAFWLIWRTWSNRSLEPLALIAWFGMLTSLTAPARFGGLGMQFSFWITLALVFGVRMTSQFGAGRGFILLCWFATIPTIVSALIGTGWDLPATLHGIPNNLIAIPWFSAVMLPLAWGIMALAAIPGMGPSVSYAADFLGWNLDWLLNLTWMPAQLASGAEGTVLILWYGFMTILIATTFYHATRRKRLYSQYS